MVLKSHRWGPVQAESIVCIHGIAQHGGIFEAFGQHFAERGHAVMAVDLRGHGESGREPPWGIERHVQDILETLDACGIRHVAWVGHSFGGRVAATIAASVIQRTGRLILLEPGLEVPPDRALRGAEMDRLDWSFETQDGAVNALLGGEGVVAAPRDTVARYVRDDLCEGPDGRYRFRFCPSAAVTAWSEMSLPAPPIARVPTLIVRTEVSLVGLGIERRYKDELGVQLAVATVPNGHNVLWESPGETIKAVEEFLGGGIKSHDPADDDELAPGYFEESGTFRLLI